MPNSAIPTFRELVFQGQSDVLQHVLDTLPNYLPSGWHRNIESEEQARGMGDQTGPYRCYKFDGNSELPSALLWLFIESTRAQVVNIIAPSEFELGYERYNLLLTQFANCVTRTIEQEGVRVAIEPWKEQTLEEVLQPEPAKLFQQFAKLANPTTGTDHPLDAERWQTFLISAHRHGVEPDEELLRRWLESELKWSENVIDQTLSELHHGLALLRKYDQSLLGK